MLEILGLLAGFLLAVGYVVYFIKSIRYEIEPNASTWLMWAYGTTLLTVIEAGLNAPWQVLVLPVTCSVCGIGVAILCVRRKRMHWPSGPDRYAFIIDVCLTVLYVSAWILSLTAVLTPHPLWIATATLLVCSNMSTVVSFIPILRSTYRNPLHEHYLPWIVWTTAYAVLIFTTFLEARGSSLYLLLIYPVSCFILHGLVALFTQQWLRRFYVWS